MRYINNLSEELEVFKALGSEVRISILNLLLERGKMSSQSSSISQTVL